MLGFIRNCCGASVGNGSRASSAGRDTPSDRSVAGGARRRASSVSSISSQNTSAQGEGRHPQRGSEAFSSGRQNFPKPPVNGSQGSPGNPLAQKPGSDSEDDFCKETPEPLSRRQNFPASYVNASQGSRGNQAAPVAFGSKAARANGAAAASVSSASHSYYSEWNRSAGTTIASVLIDPNRLSNPLKNPRDSIQEEKSGIINLNHHVQTHSAPSFLRLEQSPRLTARNLAGELKDDSPCYMKIRSNFFDYSLGKGDVFFDFASPFLGGGYAGTGNVQEEKMFYETNLGILAGNKDFRPQDGAVLIQGVRQFVKSDPEFYGSSRPDVKAAAGKGKYKHKPVEDKDQVEFTVLAKNVQKMDKDDLYETASLHRLWNDIFEAFIKYHIFANKTEERGEKTPVFHTGWIGCGAFNHNKKVVMAMQLLASRMIGREEDILFHGLSPADRSFVVEAKGMVETLLKRSVGEQLCNLPGLLLRELLEQGVRTAS